MFWIILLLILPWAGWIALAYYVRKLKKQLNHTLDEYTKLEAELLESQKKINTLVAQKHIDTINQNCSLTPSKELVSISVDKSLTKVIVKPKEMSYQQLESCMNYFIEHYHKGK